MSHRRPVRRELAHLFQLCLRDPLAKEYDKVDNKKNNNSSHKNTDNVTSYNSATMLLNVQEIVDVEVIGGMRDVREAEVES